MADTSGARSWQVDGKFFRCRGTRAWMRAVTYGPFPGGWPDSLDVDFARMAAAGFNVVRTYEMPDRRILDAAAEHGLDVFGGLMWSQNADFIGRPELFAAARVSLVEALRRTGDHPALAGVYVGNEVPSDLVRWMGPLRVREAIEELIAIGREAAPGLLFAYANYPSTEYLEPENADFTAFNIYLEEPDAFRKYLRRLHHIAGDRPLVVSECGLDSRRNGLARQAEVLSWAREISHDEETAGFTVYAWSDRWWNHGGEVTDWDFGLIDREGNAKPALAALSSTINYQLSTINSFTVIICTRNGRGRIGACLAAVARMDGAFETIVVDDGSADGTADFVSAKFPDVTLLRLDPCGLSAARNAGAAAASGSILAFTDDDCRPDAEWLVRLNDIFEDGRFAAAGGPNLPPPPKSWEEAVVCSSPGAPSHVMLDDEEAEHLPGCNLAVTSEAFHAIGGFDPQFETAGDDVDFCWRLRAAGYRLGFSPGAFVWHLRRPSLAGFLQQQAGYGRAEKLLMAKHPEKFSKCGGAKWDGFVYSGGPIRAMEGSVIYHGGMGMAGYQSVTNRMLPLRALDARFNSLRGKLSLRFVQFIAPRVRAWMRCRALIPPEIPACPQPADFSLHEFAVDGSRAQIIARLLAAGWKPGGVDDDWDVTKNGTSILLATGYEGEGDSHVLIRIHGPVPPMECFIPPPAPLTA